METIGVILTMLVAVVCSDIIVRWLPLAVPTPLVQIVLGAVIAAVPSIPDVHLDPDVFFLLFLPPLLFLDGWRIPKEGLLHDRGIILQLALGLVICTVVGMGALIHWMIPSIPYPVAFALAAIVSPTDPIAVSAISRRVPIPKRVMHVLEAESLLNDASGLVCFRFAVAAALTGTFSLSAAAVTFLELVFWGVAAGVGLTYALLRIKNWISRRLGEEPGSQVLISLLIPFGAYQLAEHLGASGILAAVSAGITMSYAELGGRSLASTRVQRTAVWDTVQFALNGVMFVLLGEELPGILSGAVRVVRDANHLNPWWLAVYALAINFGLACARFAWVWVSVNLSRLLVSWRGEPATIRPSVRLIAVVSAAGVRGAITLAGVLTAPLALDDGTPFPARDLIIFLAAAVIIVSLLVASIGLPRLVRGLAMPPDSGDEEQRYRARSIAAQAAIRAVEQAAHEMASTHEDAGLYADAASRVMESYRRRFEGEATVERAAEVRRINEIERALRLTGLAAEREALFSLARSELLSQESSRQLIRYIDLMEERLRVDESVG
jgi:monovalent cation/hydrogen antiporter